jgi:uncharacterized protein YjeT (DUF2065 family)
MLARQREVDDSAEVPTNRLKLVGDVIIGTGKEAPRRRRLGFVGSAWVRMREQMRQQPERYTRLADRLILLGIAIVLMVSVYIFMFADAG